jgi:hypothetical protein
LRTNNDNKNEEQSQTEERDVLRVCDTSLTSSTSSPILRTNNDNKNEEQSQTEERDDDEKSTLFLSVVCVSRNSFVDEKIILRRKLVHFCAGEKTSSLLEHTK